MGGGRNFTINLSPQCRAFSRALKAEKLKAPLFPGTINDWCIISTVIRPLPLIQDGQMSVSGESMCTMYWLIASKG